MIDQQSGNAGALKRERGIIPTGSQFGTSPTIHLLIAAPVTHYTSAAKSGESRNTCFRLGIFLVRTGAWIQYSENASGTRNAHTVNARRPRRERTGYAARDPTQKARFRKGSGLCIVPGVC